MEDATDSSLFQGRTILANKTNGFYNIHNSLRTQSQNCLPIFLKKANLSSLLTRVFAGFPANFTPTHFVRLIFRLG